VEGEGEWHTCKHGGPKRRVWRKIHLRIDEDTLEIRAVKVTTSNVADAPMLPGLLDQVASDQEIATVTADGAYDTRKCHDAIQCPAVHVYMHEKVRPRRGRNNPASPECHTVEADHRWRQGTKRSSAGLDLSRPCALATLERISPSEPCRGEDELREAARSASPSHRCKQRLPGNAWRATLIARLPRFRSAPQC